MVDAKAGNARILHAAKHGTHRGRQLVELHVAVDGEDAVEGGVGDCLIKVPVERGGVRLPAAFGKHAGLRIDDQLLQIGLCGGGGEGLVEGVGLRPQPRVGDELLDRFARIELHHEDRRRAVRCGQPAR